jgi:hypothetical protein
MKYRGCEVKCRGGFRGAVYTAESQRREVPEGMQMSNVGCRISNVESSKNC